MIYATADQVAEYLAKEASALPADIDRLLARASKMVDTRTLNRIDSTDADHLSAAQEAVCAQIEYWIENNEETEFSGPIRSQMAGKTLTVYAGNGNPRLAPRAKDALLLAGLLYSGVG